MSLELLRAKNLKKYYGDRLILECGIFSVYEGDKIGITGVNGSGKTTFLNLLYGSLEAEEGEVEKNCSISFFTQLGHERTEVNGRTAKEMGIAKKAADEKVSGGENVRIKLAQVFDKKSHILFADEPTANLDMEGVRLFMEKVRLFETILIVSHERSVLDGICNKIVEIKDGKLRVYEGNYTSYEQQKKREEAARLSKYENYVSQRNHLEKSLEKSRRRAKKMKKVPKRMGNSEARLHKRESADRVKKLHNASNILETRLEKLEKTEKPREEARVKIDFSLTNPPENKIVLRCDGLTFGYGGENLFTNVSFLIENGSKTAVLGENGTGKTTLLNLIKQENEAFYKVPRARIGYLYQEFENIDRDKTVLENAVESSVQREMTVRMVLARLLFTADDIGKKAAVLSGGELQRLSLAKILVSDANVLLLDEPTNYLDMPSILILQEMLQEYEGTVLFVSHDKKFVYEVGNRLLRLENKRIKPFDGTLTEYENETNRKRRVPAEKMVLESRMVKVLSELSIEKNEERRVQLDIEYRALIKRLREMKFEEGK